MKNYKRFYLLVFLMCNISYSEDQSDLIPDGSCVDNIDIKQHYKN